MTVVEDFMSLFEGRTDSYGTEEGGRAGRYTGRGMIYYPLVPDVWRQHLEGTEPIGVYPMVPHDQLGMHHDHDTEWFVKWGAVDFDVKTKGKPSWDYETEQDAHIASTNLSRVLSALGVTSWIERTRSSGRHVWVFCSTWVSASTMRRALLTACSVAGVSAREVNPKQETLGSDQLGNYVRLPYPGALASGYTVADETRVMVGERWRYSECNYNLDVFVRMAMEARTPAATLEAIAQKWREPAKPKPIQPHYGHSDLVGHTKLNAAARSIAAYGPEDGDRSRGMAYFAYQCRLSGCTQGETLAHLHSLAWNKFRDRRDEDQRLQEIVVGAWQ